MAIDDVIVLANSHCTLPTTTTTPATTTTLGRHTPVSCDFENNLCSWTHDLTASGKWLRHQGNTSDLQTGPLFGKY